LSLGRARCSRAAGATPSESDVVDPPTPDDDDAADAPVVLDGDDPATPYDAVPPAGAPTIPDDDDPAIPDAVTPASSGDGDPMVPGADAPKCDGNPVIPTADAPMTSRACAPRVPGDVVPRTGSWCLTTMFSSFETRNGSRSVSAKLPHLSGGFARSRGFTRGALSVRLSNGEGVSSSYATSKVPSVKLPSAVGPDTVLAAT